MNKTKAFLIALLPLISGCDKEKIPLDGERKSFITLDESLRADPVLANVPVTIGAPLQNKLWTHASSNAEHNMQIFSLNTTLQKKWTANIGYGNSAGNHIVGNMVSDNHYVYAIDAKGFVSAFDINSGTEIFRKSTSPVDGDDDVLGGGLCLHKETIFVTNSLGLVLAINSKTGETLWQSQTSTPIRIAPSTDGRNVYVISLNNELTAFNAITGKKVWSNSGITESSCLLGGASVAIQGDTIIATLSSGEIYALKSDTGQILWTDTLTPAVRVDTVSSIPHIKAEPVIDGEIVYVLSHGGKMAAYKMKTGAKVWQRDIAGTETPLVIGNFLCVITSTSEVIMMEKATGKIKWVSALPKILTESKKSIYWMAPRASQHEILITGSHGEIAQIDFNTGKIKSTISYDGAATTGPIIVDNKLFLLTANGELVLYA
jgi:outer membrane protein assembly factor BamB